MCFIVVIFKIKNKGVFLVKKNINRISCLIVLVILLIECLPISLVFAKEEDEVIKYYPYSSWANELAIKHKLVLNENPKRAIQRWEVASIIYLLLDEPKGKSENKFDDMEAVSDYVRERIGVVAKRGIVFGYEDNTFKPFGGTTRAEFVVMLNRSGILEGKKDINTSDFGDIDGHWAKESIISVVKKGILKGKSESSFVPDASITIEEVFVIIDRILDSNSRKISETMLDVFGGKNYTEDDEYVFEEIYCKFDEIQNKMRAYWYDVEHYDYNNWSELVKVKDLIPVFYNCYKGIGKNTSKATKLSKWQETIDDARKVLDYSGSDEDLLEQNVTMDGFMSMWAENAPYGRSYVKSAPKEKVDKIKFENLLELPEDYYVTLVYWSVRDLLLPSEKKFPSNIYLNKLIYNYFIANIYKEQAQDLIKIYHPDWNIQLEESALPSNHRDLTIILDHIPKEVYEYPLYVDPNKDENGIPRDPTFSPKKYWEKYIFHYDKIYGDMKRYYEILLNVDYRTIEEEQFIKDIREVCDCPFPERIRKYVRYVKEHKIVIEGKGEPIYGFVYAGALFHTTRGMVDFNIVNADTDKNLLLFDEGFYSSEGNRTIVYTEKEYRFCHEVILQPKHYAPMEGEEYLQTPVAVYKILDFPIMSSICK